MQDLFVETVFFQNTDCFIGRDAVRKLLFQRQRNSFPAAGSLFRDLPQDLHPMVAVLRVRVFDPARDFDQLSDVSHEEHTCKSGFGCHLYRIIDKIGGCHCCLDGKIIFLKEKIFSVITRCRSQDRHSLAVPDADLCPDRIQKRLVTHRFHDPAGPQNRNPAPDPQFRIEGLRGELPPPGYGDRHLQAVFSACFCRFHGFSDRRFNHPARCAVDRCASDRLIEPRLCDAANPLPAVDPDARSVGQGSCRANQGSICDVRIISAVLAHSTGDGRIKGRLIHGLPVFTGSLYILTGKQRTGLPCPLLHPNLPNVQNEFYPSRRHQTDMTDLLPGKEHKDCRFSRSCGTASCRITKAETLPPFFDIFFEHTLVP